MTSKFFTKNRLKLLRDLQAHVPIVLTANGLLQRTSDNTFPFAQESNFWYLTGIDLPDITLVIDGANEYLIVPGRSASRQAFDGEVDVAQLTEISGIEKIYAEEEGWAKLGQPPKIQTLGAVPAYIEQHGMYVNPARGRLLEHFEEITDIRPQLARLRSIKQPEELEAIQRAIDITNDSLKLLFDRFTSYKNEYEVEADLTREFRFRGATGHAFAPIIAGGKRACTLHNVTNEAPLQPNSLVVCDVGAEVSHYAADITRTVCHGQPTARQQAVYDAVQDVQAYALSMLKPGTMLKDYEKSVEDYMGGQLKLLGLKGPTRQYFPHATSHFLGLDVHDVGPYDDPLAESMVITCEPGIYISEEAIGVRLEDDVLITADGSIVLSAKLPKMLVLK